jgi:hypothetical protein
MAFYGFIVVVFSAYVPLRLTHDLFRPVSCLLFDLRVTFRPTSHSSELR